MWDKRNSAYFSDNSRSCRQIQFLVGAGGCLSSSKPFDFGVDPDHDPDSGILTAFFTISDSLGFLRPTP